LLRSRILTPPCVLEVRNDAFGAGRRAALRPQHRAATLHRELDLGVG
jgi:hypothetical protein